MKQRYTVPTHMNLPDRLFFGLTVRQVLTLLAGLALSYQCWQVLRFLDAFGFLWLCVHIAVSALPTLLSLVVAFVVVRERFLELWTLAAMRYSTLPKTYTWQCSKESLQAGEEIAMKSARWSRQEKLKDVRGGEKG